MTEAVWTLTPAVREEPLRRLLWVLPVAILLVLAALLVLGHWLHGSASLKPPPPPIRARIYELPPSPGTAPSQATPSHPAPSRAAPPPTQARPRPTPPPSRPHTRSEIAHPLPHGNVAVPKPRPRSPTPAPPAPARPHIDWSRLHSDVNAAVAAANNRHSTPLQIHDPNTLTAHFYIASVLRKLQDVGNLNYPGQLTGVSVVRLRIDRHGKLIGLKLLKSSGNPALDRAAENIVRMSAPFAPFPNRLLRKTHRLELTCYMDFYGYRQLYTEY